MNHKKVESNRDGQKPSLIRPKLAIDVFFLGQKPLSRKGQGE